MRGDISNGNASGIPASQRLKLKLSRTVGMHLLTNQGQQDVGGLLSPGRELKHERVIHRTKGVTRSLSSVDSLRGLYFTSSDSVISLGVSSFLRQGSQSLLDVESRPSVIVTVPDETECVDRSSETEALVVELRDAAAGDQYNTTGASADAKGDPTVSLSLGSEESTVTPARGVTADVAEESVLGLGASDSIIVTNADPPGDETERSHLMNHFTCLSADGSQREINVDCSSEDAKRAAVAENEDFYTSLSCVGLDGIQKDAVLQAYPGLGNIDEERQDNSTGEEIVVCEIIDGIETSEPSITSAYLYRKETGSEGAALRIQSVWKGWQQRRQYILEAAIRHDAALVIQKHWRAAKSRVLLKHLKIENVIRNRAATVIQANFRAFACKREFFELKCAARTVQTSWRRHNSLKVALELSRRTEAARLAGIIVIQAHARRYLVRVEVAKMLKAAVVIQRQWLAYKDTCTRAATKLQTGFRAFLARKLYKARKQRLMEERAAVRIQAYARGHLLRCHLTILHTAALIIQLQWRRYYRRCELRATISENTSLRNLEMRLESPTYTGANYFLRPANGEEKEIEHRDEFIGAGLSLHSDTEIKKDMSFPQTAGVVVLEGKGDSNLKCDCKVTGHAGLSKKRDDSGLRPLLNGGSPAIPSDKIPVGKDWNGATVSHYSEGRETRQASQKPCPFGFSESVIAAEQCSSKFVILEEIKDSNRSSGSRSLSAGSFSERDIEYVNIVINTEAQAESSSHAAPQPQCSPSRELVGSVIGDSLISFTADGSLNQNTVVLRDSRQAAYDPEAKANREMKLKSEHPQLVLGRDHDGGNVECKSRRGGSAKREEERLKQFAQVFLLQRYIVCQQQRAQLTPPFPPSSVAASNASPALSLRSSKDACTDERDASSAVVQRLQGSTSCSQSTSGQCNIAQGNVHSAIVPSAFKQPSSYEIESTLHPILVHGTDVVVDMVQLLSRIKEVYGTSDVELEGDDSFCFPTRSGDIEAGGSVYDRRERSSSLGFPNSLSMTRISFPNVNAMLLLIIAMVVYTKTVCQGVLFGSKKITEGYSV